MARRANDRTETSHLCAPIAVCAADETLRARIAAVVELAGHEVVLRCDSIDALVEDAGRCGSQLAVLALGFEPFTAAAELEPLDARLGQLSLIVVAAGFLGAACRRLVPNSIEALVQESRLEQTLAPAIEAVLGGQLCVPASMRDALAQPVFSHREKQVLELLLAGLTNAEIAAQLYLSESTVKSHLATSFRKLGVSSRAEAARCFRAGDSGLELRALSVPGSDPSLAAS